MAEKTYSQLIRELSAQIGKSKGEIIDRNRIIHNSDYVRTSDSTAAQVKLDGLKDYYIMRKSWGNFLKICLCIILVFNILLVFLVGSGVLVDKDDWFLRIVLTTNLADIIGLVYLVVNFLFSNQIESVKEKQK